MDIEVNNYWNEHINDLRDELREYFEPGSKAHELLDALWVEFATSEDAMMHPHD